MVVDDTRSQITESKSERIENDFSGNQPISAWQWTVTRRNFTTAPRKSVKIRGGTHRIN